MTTSGDGTIRRFDCAICGSLDDLEALSAGRLGRLGRALTEAERARYLENERAARSHASDEP